MPALFSCFCRPREVVNSCAPFEERVPRRSLIANISGFFSLSHNAAKRPPVLFTRPSAWSYAGGARALRPFPLFLHPARPRSSFPSRFRVPPTPCPLDIVRHSPNVVSGGCFPSLLTHPIAVGAERSTDAFRTPCPTRLPFMHLVP